MLSKALKWMAKTEPRIQAGLTEIEAVGVVEHSKTPKYQYHDNFEPQITFILPITVSGRGSSRLPNLSKSNFLNPGS